MCKFTNHLFVFAVLSLLYADLFIEASPCSKKKKKCEDHKELTEYDQDIYIDQRQKGNENLRIRMDGFLIGAKQPSSSDLISIGDSFLSGLGEDLILTLSKNRSQPSEPFGLLISKRLSPRVNAKSSDTENVETILVEREIDPRQNYGPDIVEEHAIGPQTKLRIYRLLNLLRGSDDK